ncbi:MAG: zinc-dependent metalloprotease [Bradymonadia bacterium]
MRRITLSMAMLTVMGFGCAEPVEDINKVQPHYQQKSMFEGEWYYRQTVVEVAPEVADIVFQGLEGNLEKVKFDFTNGGLEVRRLYESVPGLNEDEALPGGELQGDPVIGWPVNYFDIIREYNATTGERSNVISENTSDRPWYERDYVRVDWASPTSINSGSDFTGYMDFVLSFDANGGSKDFVRETETFDPDALIVTDDYIQITQTYTIQDLTYNCYFTYGNFNCGTGEVRLRHSFHRVNPNDIEKFQPRDYADIVEARDENKRKVRTIGLPVDTIFAIEANATSVRNLGESCDTPVQCGEDATCIIQGDSGICAEQCESNDQCGPGRACMAGECTALLVDFACTPALKEYLDGVISPDWLDLENDCRSVVTEEQFGRFGYFRTERFGYDRRLGTIDENREFNATVHRVFKTSYELDAEGNVMRDDEGNKVELPMSERELQPIVYYLNVEYPEDLKALTVEIGQDWNEAYMAGAMSATGKSREEIESQLAADYEASGDFGIFLTGDYDQRALFQIRENNCSYAGVQRYLGLYPEMESVVEEATYGEGLKEDSPTKMFIRTCSGLRNESVKRGLAQSFEWQQVGDVRYSYVYWVNEDQAGGPLGFGPSSKDPETGEIISGNAYVYGAAVDRYARYAADIVLAINDDEYVGGLISGESYNNWVDDTPNVAGQPQFLTADLQDEVRRRMGSQRLDEGFDPITQLTQKLNPAMAMEFAKGRLGDNSASFMEAGGAIADEAQVRLDRAKADPRMRSLLLTDSDLILAEKLKGPGMEDIDVEDLAMDIALQPGRLREQLQGRDKFFMDRNMYLPEFMDDSVIGLALSLRGEDPEVIYQTLRREIYKAVMLHEIGHTVGLTHNFASSFDSLNYQDEYWQIRQNVDPAEWKNERLPEYQYGSIMDYGGRFHSDTKGLGKYDYAAVKFGYFRQVEAWDENVVPKVVYYAPFISNLIHGFEHLPSLFGGSENFNARKDVLFDDLLQQRVDGVLRNTEMLTGNRRINADEWWIDRTVPYEYCADIYNGNLTCRTWDEGANHTEAVASAIQNYWNYYMFNNYRRGRTEFSFINGFFGRQSRLQAYLTYPFRFYYFYQYSELYLEQDMLQSVVLGLNFISQVLGIPEPGRYCLSADENVYMPAGFMDREACEADSIEIAEGVGRKQNIEFSDQYLGYVDYIGTYYDKANFLLSMFDTSSLFFRAWLGDSRRFSIGYYRTFRPEIVNLIRDMVFSMLGDREATSFNSAISQDGVVPPRLIDYNTFGTGLAPETEGMPRLQSGLPYSIAWRGLLMSAVFNTSTYDAKNDFVEYITVIEAGSGEDRQFVEGTPVATFVHPTTGLTYKAPETYEGGSISFELLTRAQAYVDGEWTAAFDAWQETLPSEDENGEVVIPEFTDAEIAARLSDYQEAERRLGEMVDLMSDLRYLRKVVGHTTD